MRVRVEAPASSANLGPGFDALGLALDVCDVVEIEAYRSEEVGPKNAQKLSIDILGEEAANLPRDDQHLVVASFRSTLQELSASFPSHLAVSCHNTLPHGRGLGSSAAAIVSGVLAAQVFAGEQSPNRDTALRIANRLEGHPDNVAPCLLGGLTVSWLDPGNVAHAVTMAVHPDVTPVLCVPPTKVATEYARSLLPEAVPHTDAAKNAARSALLTHALSSRPDLLFNATEDFLHQRYREPAMPESLGVIAKFRSAGLAAVISGAGPTVLVLTDKHRVSNVERMLPLDWRMNVTSVRPRGAHVEVLSY